MLILSRSIAGSSQISTAMPSRRKNTAGFNDTWGQVVVTALEKLYPYLTHIEAVDAILKEHEPYTGVNQIAYTTLVEGQGLRHALNQQQQRDKDKQVGEESNAKKRGQRFKK